MDQEIHQVMWELLSKRGPQKSICPSEVAKKCFPEGWRIHMEVVRKVAYEWAEEGKVMITQKGIPVDPARVKGPIRIKIKN